MSPAKDGSAIFKNGTPYKKSDITSSELFEKSPPDEKVREP